MSMNNRGFFAALVDLKFESFVLPQIIRVAYVLMLVGAVLGTVGLIAAGFSEDEEAGFALMLFSPLILLVWVVYVRVLLESVIVAFRLLENTDELVQMGRWMQGGGSVPQQGQVNPQYGGHSGQQAPYSGGAGPQRGGYYPNQD